MKMTPKLRAIEALELRTPDQVPTFELEFQLEDKMYGKPFFPEELNKENFSKLSESQRGKKIQEYVEYMDLVYTDLEYSIIPAYSPFCNWVDSEKGIMSDDYKLFLKLLKQIMNFNMY